LWSISNWHFCGRVTCFGKWIVLPSHYPSDSLHWWHWCWVSRLSGWPCWVFWVWVLSGPLHLRGIFGIVFWGNFSFVGFIRLIIIVRYRFGCFNLFSQL
jgi:hypothetical protein